mgnify:CR=1
MCQGSRRDDEDVLNALSRRSNEEIGHYFSFPLGGLILASFFVARRSRA